MFHRLNEIHSELHFSYFKYITQHIFVKHRNVSCIHIQFQIRDEVKAYGVYLYIVIQYKVMLTFVLSAENIC